MLPRTDYEMTEADMELIMDAGKPTPVMFIGGRMGASPQENANAAWAALGAKMGFDSMSVRASSGKGHRFFTAVPNETSEAKAERIERDKEVRKAEKIQTLEAEIWEREKVLAELKAEASQ